MTLNLIVLRSNKMEDAKAFYSAFGARFSSEQHGNGPTHYAAKLGELIFEIYPAAEGMPPDPGLRLGLSVADLHETLRSIGQHVSPRQTAWGLRAVVRDPDGRAVELCQA